MPIEIKLVKFAVACLVVAFLPYAFSAEAYYWYVNGKTVYRTPEAAGQAGIDNFNRELIAAGADEYRVFEGTCILETSGNYGISYKGYRKSDGSMKVTAPCESGLYFALCQNNQKFDDVTQRCVTVWPEYPVNNGIEECNGTNPIFGATGNKTQLERDFRFRPGFEIVRRYNSQAHSDGLLGRGWSLGLLTRIERNHSGLVLVRDNGSDIQFVQRLQNGQSTGVYWSAAAPGAEITVIKNATKLNGWVLVDADGVVSGFNVDGDITSLRYRSGYQLNFQYQAKNRVSGFSDSFGNTFSIDLAGQNPGKIVAVRNVLGVAQVEYRYNDEGYLSEVIYADGTSRQYRYVPYNEAFLLAGIVDESGIEYASWTYDSTGRAILSVHAGDTDKYSLTYRRTSSPSGPLITSVITDPLGKARTYEYRQDKNGRWLRTSASAPCPADPRRDIKTVTYDDLGNALTRLDFNGVKNTYSYEANSWRETARTEAAGTPQARTITTTWHPTLRLPATLTEPGRVTEFSYDPNGNLLSKKVTADGVSRTQSWSYLANGLLDTATDARGKVTRYTYDAQGNLATVTNP
ncbi:DUF6531 domain-containing protein, partial [Chitiniphilus shinanonensis]|uniref:DUF6531 domain-containing protein n=1 Tax=Chitiniphilus shinanonensis TaxID=553088 RepID=UPI0024E06C11